MSLLSVRHFLVLSYPFSPSEILSFRTFQRQLICWRKVQRVEVTVHLSEGSLVRRVICPKSIGIGLGLGLGLGSLGLGFELGLGLGLGYG